VSGDSKDLSREEVAALVREIITEVLMVGEDVVLPETALVAELGAESIDFLDLIFRLEEGLGEKIPTERWRSYVAEKLGDEDLRTAITTDFVSQFAEVILGES
jgi:acyl carrier protein